MVKRTNNKHHNKTRSPKRRQLSELTAAERAEEIRQFKGARRVLPCQE